MGFVDADRNQAMGDMSARLNIAAVQGPEAVMRELATHQNTLQQIGVSPEQAWQTYQQSPEGFTQLTDLIGMHAVGPEKYFDIQDKLTGREIDRGRLAETIRSNKAGEGLQARGQNITMRGQDMSASTARRGQDLAMQRANARTISGVEGNRVVQLADGRTVNIDGKLHGAGANAFYEGIDDNGNMVRVPASAIAAPPTSAASAQNHAMKKDIDAIANADASALDFMTGMTGGAGNPAIGADVRSRLTGKEQRQLYNSAQRIQGRMQNQGVAAARDMGASGINTIAEAKMYFQGCRKLTTQARRLCSSLFVRYRNTPTIITSSTTLMLVMVGRNHQGSSQRLSNQSEEATRLNPAFNSRWNDESNCKR